MYVKVINYAQQFEHVIECSRVAFCRDSSVEGIKVGTLSIRPLNGGDEYEWLLSGNDRAYVMNEHGKTIDTFIPPVQQPETIEPQTE